VVVKAYLLHMSISTLSVNLLVEQVFLEGQVHMMYENILTENTEVDSKSKSIVKKVAEDMKINADFMFTFGVGISAFVGPVNELLKNKGVNITEYDVTLLLITAFYILLSKSKKEIDYLMDLIQNRGQEKELKNVIDFVGGSMKLFKIVGNKIGLTINSLTDVLAFTFMSVPVLNMIKDFASQKGFTIDDGRQLFTGIVLSASAYLIKNVMNKRK